MKDGIVVTYDSPHAAHRATKEGWESRHGRFYPDSPRAERMARYDGCTHMLCEKCGCPVDKLFVLCPTHLEERLTDSYRKLEKREWDRKTPLVTFGGDEYFRDADTLLEYCVSEGISPEDLRLVICEPNYAHGISSSIWEDILPEEYTVPKELEDALNAFNKAVEAYKEPVSWDGGNYAAIIPQDIVADWHRIKLEDEE